MLAVPLPWTCFRCGTQFHDRVAWCTTCAAEGLVGPSACRPRSVTEQVAEAATARELAAASWTLVTSARYPTIRFLRGALCLLYGPPASGKSTLALGMLDGFDCRSVAYLSEEGLAPAVGERLARLGIRDDRMLLLARASLDQLVEHIVRQRARAAAIDSISSATLSPSELRHVLVVAGLGVLICVQQVNKNGQPSGVNAYMHEADVAVEVIDGRWRVVKSRFQSAGEGGEVDHGRLGHHPVL
jgi:predicted ATP-dependent serine protease